MPTHSDDRTCFHRRAIGPVCALGLLLTFAGGALGAEASTPAIANTTYSSPPPVYGGDPVPGETDESYFARTGDRLPASSGYGGDPVPGETDESYFARTGDHVRV